MTLEASIFASMMWLAEASDLSCLETRSRFSVCISLLQVLMSGVQELFDQSEDVVCPNHTVCYSKFQLNSSGSTRIMLWRLLRISRTKISLRGVQRVLSFLRASWNCIRPLKCAHLLGLRLGANPRRCFEKYVDVSSLPLYYFWRLF